jgi:hypothetical protein
VAPVLGVPADLLANLMGRHALRRRTYAHGLLDGLLAAWLVALGAAAWTDRWLYAERVLAVVAIAAVATSLVIFWRARWSRG